LQPVAVIHAASRAVRKYFCIGGGVDGANIRIAADRNADEEWERG
jgi:hypothetical protein